MPRRHQEAGKYRKRSITNDHQVAPRCSLRAENCFLAGLGWALFSPLQPSLAGCGSLCMSSAGRNYLTEDWPPVHIFEVTSLCCCLLLGVTTWLPGCYSCSMPCEVWFFRNTHSVGEMELTPPLHFQTSTFHSRLSACPPLLPLTWLTSSSMPTLPPRCPHFPWPRVISFRANSDPFFRDFYQRASRSRKPTGSARINPCPSFYSFSDHIFPGLLDPHSSN